MDQSVNPDRQFLPPAGSLTQLGSRATRLMRRSRLQVMSLGFRKHCRAAVHEDHQVTTTTEARTATSAMNFSTELPGSSSFGAVAAAKDADNCSQSCQDRRHLALLCPLRVLRTTTTYCCTFQADPWKESKSRHIEFEYVTV